MNHKQMLIENKSRLEAALPQHIPVGDFVRLALTEIQRNPKLMDCDPQSVFLACMEAARLGAIPGTLGHGWLIPRRIKGKAICNFHPGYRLFIDLARRSGQVLRVDAHVVYEGDEFELAYGTAPVLIHKPNLTGAQGLAIGAYAVAHLTHGGVQVEFMTTDDIEKARAAGAQDSPAWTMWWSEMAKKVVLKRASKLWPLAVEDQRHMDTLVSYDHGVETEPLPSLPDPSPITARIQSYTEAEVADVADQEEC